jgi:HK97 family phage prohead protease
MSEHTFSPDVDVRTIQMEMRVDTPESGEPPKIVGYAAMFDALSQDLGGFVERIERGAFARSLAEGADVRALFNHDSNLILGRTKAGTLAVREDAQGLAIEIIPPDTSYARDLLVSIERGDVSQMSFAFRTRVDEWDTGKNPAVRTLKDVELFDVSPVTYPAYTQTSVSVRAQVATMERERQEALERRAEPEADDPLVVDRYRARLEVTKRK